MRKSSSTPPGVTPCRISNTSAALSQPAPAILDTSAVKSQRSFAVSRKRESGTRAACAKPTVADSRPASTASIAALIVTSTLSRRAS
ncbi:MAG TPA: hypothetical protein VM864_06320 [Pyrinomonadaceae bacterium]|nr:hypothetical protein [Pyrinomonadaceae bacterium]